jgi:hypothetical protein
MQCSTTQVYRPGIAVDAAMILFDSAAATIYMSRAFSRSAICNGIGRQSMLIVGV